MPTQVVTQLIVDSQGAVTGVAAFEAAMQRAKGSFENLDAPIKSFDKSQRDLGRVMASNDPVFAAQLKMQAEMERQNITLTNAVKLGQISQTAANAEMAKTVSRHEALIVAAKGATTAQKLWAEATEGVKGQLIALAGGAGPVGTFLAAIPGWGLPAAAALGAIVEALHFMGEEATRMGELSRMLKDSAQIMGVNTDQLQALNIIAATVGVSADKNALAFERFTVQLNELRQGTGTLFTELHKVSPELVTQLAATNNAASAIDLLAKSYAAATDQVKKNAIARAAFGRDGFNEGRVLTAIDTAGGIEAYRAGLNKTDILTQDQIKHWALLSVEIEHATNMAKNNIASIFTDGVLQAQERFAHGFLAISRAAKDFQVSGDLSKVIWLATIGGGPLVSLLGLGLGKAVSPEKAGAPAPLSIEGIQSRVGTAEATKPAFQLETLKLWMSAMGSATTITEQFTEKNLALTVAYDKMQLGTKGTVEATERLNRARTALNLDEMIARESARNSLLGASAPIYDIVKQKMDEVAKKQIELGDSALSDKQVANIKRVATAQADGTAAINAQADAQKIQLATQGQSVGQAAATHALMALQLEDLRAGRVATDEVTAARKKAADALGADTQITAQSAAQRAVDFDRQTVFMSDLQKQIATVQRQLHGDDWKSFMNDGLAATMRLTDGLKQLKDAGTAFADSFVQGMLEGKNAAQALIGAADQLAKTLAKKGVENIITGALSGDPVQAAMGVFQVASAFLITAFTGQSKAAQKAAEELAKAQEAWTKMLPEVAAFTDLANGVIAGDFTNKIRAAGDEYVKIWNAAFAAHNMTGQLQAAQDYAKILERIRNEFKASFDGMLTALKSGFGFDSPFVKGAQNVQQLTDRVKQFVADTQIAFSQSQENSNLGGFTTLAGPVDASRQIVTAQVAGQRFLISLLTGVKPLSDIASKMQEIQGTAAQLRSALTDLGLSAADAATAIAEGVTAAIDQLRQSFTEDLQRQINDASGKGFLNDFADLFKTINQSRQDAALLGTGTDLVERFFGIKAQKIIDDAGLVGDSFNELITTFPQLTGVVHESKKALDDQIAAQQKLSDIAKSIVNYIADLQGGANSSLSPQGRLNAAVGAYNSQLALAQGGNLDAQSTITQYFETARKANQDFYGSSAAYQQFLATGISQLLALPAVTAATDPVVTALASVVTAIGLTTTAVGGTTSAVGTGNTTLSSIEGYTNATKANTAATNTLIDTGSTLLKASNTLADSSNTLITSSNTIANSIKGVLDQLVTLNTTSKDALTVLQTQYQTSGTYSVDVRSVTGSATTSSASVTVITALQKIVANTYAAALNTAGLLAIQMGFAANGQQFYKPSALAGGGTIQPYGLAYVSEHSSNPRFLRAGPEPISVFPGSPANDNGGIIRELQSLRRESADQNFKIAQLINLLCDLTGKSAEEIVGAIDDQTDKLEASARQDRNNPKNRAA